MMLIDSNIIIYAINISSPKHESAQIFLQEHISKLCVAHQNVLESLRVLTHSAFPNPMNSTDALEAVTQISSMLTILSPEPLTYEIVKTLIDKHQIRSNALYDAYLVATMLTHSVTRIATDNEKDFSVFPNIIIVNPFRKK